MATFYLAMTLYPAVFKRAQEEIDRVIGDDRLPSFTDHGSLPYISAVLKEVLRWEVILPAGIICYYRFACIEGDICTIFGLQAFLTPRRKRMIIMAITSLREQLLFLMSGKLASSLRESVFLPLFPPTR